MKEYKIRIEEIRNLFNGYKESKEKAYELSFSEYDNILTLLDESKKLRAKAIKKLKKLAEDCGFRILQDLKYDFKFEYVATSIEAQIDSALEALHSVSRFNHAIDLA